MAIFRFEAKLISRGSGGGRSAVAAASYRSGKFANSGKSAASAAAYRAGAMLVDERTGQRYDYTKKRGVLGAEILVPEGAVLWARDRQQLWAAVERAEKRKDAQLARDFILTLPHELSQAQREELTRAFVREHLCAQGLVADIAWHAPSRQGDERNYHAHVMVPLRRLEGEGFARKKDRPPPGEHPAKAWKGELERLREAFAATANRHLAAAGLDIRLDHRSLAEQGIERVPEPKQGPLATQIERQGRESLAGHDRRAVQALNAERAALKAEGAALAVEAARIEAELRRDAAAGGRGEAMVERPTDKELRQQVAREAEGLRQLRAQELARQQEQARAAFTRQTAQAAEEARKQRAQVARDEAERQQRGELASASARYSLALGDHYDIRDPYGSLAKAAMAEYRAFVTGQEELRREIGKEQDAEKRWLLELRREIEAHDYMTITSQRLAGMSATIAGREDAPQARLDRAKAEAHAARAAELRQERSALLQARLEREQPGQAGRVAERAQATRPAPRGPQDGAKQERAGMARAQALAEDGRQAAGQPAQPGLSADPVQREAAERQGRAGADRAKSEDAARAGVTGRKEGDAALSEAQQAKLDRLQASRAAYAEHAAQKAKDRDRGGGGRSGR